MLMLCCNTVYFDFLSVFRLRYIIGLIRITVTHCNVAHRARAGQLKIQDLENAACRTWNMTDYKSNKK